MRLPPVSSIPLLAVSFLLVSHAAAQQDLPKLPNGGSIVPVTSQTAAAETSSETAASTKVDDSTTSKPTAITATSTTSGKTSKTSLGASKTEKAALSGFPKLDQDKYPDPTVPPTADAPFMQKSNLPDGTVFICVGAALGFVGFLVIAWRGLVAWSLHRSVKKAAIAQSAKYSRVGDPRAHPGKTKGPYFNPGPGSTMSLDQLGALGASGKAGAKHQSGHGSLFFSPTAGAGMQNAGNRGSGYLPAGYYAAGNNAAPGGGAGMSHLGAGNAGIGLSNLGPQTHRYSRARSTGPTPPASPSLPPSRGGESTYGGRLSTAGLTANASNSSLNLTVPPEGRAPSAYLEDLFENHPPGTPPPEEHRRGSRGRF